MNLTTEQKKIVEVAASLKNNESLKINAFAGTGKTTTLKAITQSLSNKTILYLAFNNDIVKEAKKKLSSNVFVCTTHSLAYKKIIKEKGYKIVLEEYKTHDIVEILNVSFQIAYDVFHIFNIFCNSDYDTINNVSRNYVARDLKSFEYAESFYLKMKNKEIPVSHSFYLKEYQLCSYASELKFDYTLLDEAQDTNPVTIKIFNSILSNKIIVGDRHQTIYQFRGSANAMYILDSHYDENLTTTFRCNQKIVDIANRILEKFKNENTKLISGVTNSDVVIKDTAYITRTNGQIINIIQKLEDFNCLKDIDEIFSLSFAVYAFLNKKKIQKKYKYLEKFKNEKELSNYIEEYNDMELRTALRNAKMFKGYLYVIYNKAKAKNNPKSENILVTAHSSKGLEWDRVIIDRDFKILTSLANEIEIEQETNLLYVAITRAKKEVKFLKSEVFFIPYHTGIV